MTQNSLVSVITALCLPLALAVPASAQAPRVIGGDPNNEFASIAVFLEIGDFTCTGSLVHPRIILTADHCVQDGSALKSVAPEEFTVYPPGADTYYGPAQSRVIDVVVDEDWSSATDIAFLVLDEALGEPGISRMATIDEVVSWGDEGLLVTLVGYGLTGPRNSDDSDISSIPLAVSSPLEESSGATGFVVTGDGSKGTCAGDSGGPYLIRVGSEILILGPLMGGWGPPCEEEDVESPGQAEDSGVIASAFPILYSTALSKVGESGAVSTQACVLEDEFHPQCFEGGSWSVEYCSDSRQAVVYEKNESGWQRVSRLRGKKRISQCGRDHPYLFRYADTGVPGNYTYRINFKKTRGVRASKAFFTVEIT